MTPQPHASDVSVAGPRHMGRTLLLPRRHTPPLASGPCSRTATVGTHRDPGDLPTHPPPSLPRWPVLGAQGHCHRPRGPLPHPDGTLSLLRSLHSPPMDGPRRTTLAAHPPRRPTHSPSEPPPYSSPCRTSLPAVTPGPSPSSTAPPKQVRSSLTFPTGHTVTPTICSLTGRTLSESGWTLPFIGTSTWTAHGAPRLTLHRQLLRRWQRTLGGRGCLVMILVTPGWASAAINVQPITADLLQGDQGGSPFMMELIALTGGLQLLTQLNLTGTVITDCQSLTRKLQQGDVLRRNTTSPGFPLRVNVIG